MVKANTAAVGRLVLTQGRENLAVTARLEDAVRQLETGWEAQLILALDTVLPQAPLLSLIKEFTELGKQLTVSVPHEILGGWDALYSNRTEDGNRRGFLLLHLIRGALAKGELVQRKVALPGLRCPSIWTGEKGRWERREAGLPSACKAVTLVYEAVGLSAQRGRDNRFECYRLIRRQLRPYGWYSAHGAIAIHPVWGPFSGS